MALVVDGVVTRQKTDDTHPDSPDFPQQRGCARGRSQRQRVFGADRLKYPMKRAHWAPGGGDKSLRGKDEWVRISWDEALDIVASEIKRINEKHGPGSSYGAPMRLQQLVVMPTAGDLPFQEPGHLQGRVLHRRLPAVGTDRITMRKSKLVVMWSSDPISSSGGNPTYNYMQTKKAGAKFIFIDPYYNHSAQVLADEWIPIRPGTDTPMLLAMGYVLITEDNPVTNPLIDWNFINNNTIGFDKTTFPEGADPEDNYRDYVLGLDKNGKPAPEGHKNYPAKTPEWASKEPAAFRRKKSARLRLSWVKPIRWHSWRATPLLESIVLNPLARRLWPLAQ